MLSVDLIQNNQALLDLFIWSEDGIVKLSDIAFVLRTELNDLNLLKSVENNKDFVLTCVNNVYYIQLTDLPTRFCRVHKDSNTINLGKSPLVWIDLELTGLDISKDQIIEIAVIVSDEQAENFIIGPNLIIHTTDEILSSMDEWCTKHHGDSGLTTAVRNSSISLEDAEKIVMKFLTETCHLNMKQCYLAGNSVHEDRTFIRFQMPNLYNFLHYRIVDVSSLKVLIGAWYKPHVNELYRKKECHRALDDIKESIGELRQYHINFFK